MFVFFLSGTRPFIGFVGFVECVVRVMTYEGVLVSILFLGLGLSPGEGFRTPFSHHTRYSI